MTRATVFANGHAFTGEVYHTREKSARRLIKGRENVS